MDYSEILGGTSANDIISQLISSNMGDLELAKTKAASNRAYFSRFKPKYSTSYSILIPIRLTLNVNPVTGIADEQVNRDKPMTFPMSFEKASTILRQLATTNDATRKYLVDTLGEENASIDDPSVRLTSKQSAKWHSAFGTLLIFTNPVHMVHFPSESSDFGYRIGSRAVYDPESGILSGSDILSQAANLENRLLAIRIKNETDKMKAEKKTEKDIADAVKNIRNSKMISPAYFHMVLPCLVFQKDASSRLDLKVQENKDFMAQKYELVPLVHWFRLKKDNHAKLKSMLGDTKADTDLNWLEFKLTVGAEDQEQEALTQLTPEAAAGDYKLLSVDEDAPATNIDIERFENCVAELFDDEEFWKREKWLKSITDFHLKDEDTLRNLISTNIPSVYASEIASKDLSSSYRNILLNITKVGLSLEEVKETAEDAEILKLEDQIKKEVIDKETGESQVISDEETKIFAEEMKAEENADSSLDIDSLLADDDSE